MTLSSFTALGLLFITARLPAEVDAGPCFLCKDHHEMPSRVDCLLDPGTGKTCFDLYTQLLMNEDWSQCLEYRHAYQDACCGDDADNLCYTGPTSSPVYKGETGDEPLCNICGTEEFPGKPGHIFSTRYVGTYNCREHYDRGLHGLIPGYLCGPLQDYAKEACGCGEYHPDCIEDPTKCYGYSSIYKPGMNEVHDDASVTAKTGFGAIVACCVVAFVALALVYYLEKSRSSTNSAAGNTNVSTSPDDVPNTGKNELV